MEADDFAPNKDADNKVNPLLKKLADEFGIGVIFFLASLAAKSREEDLRKNKENNSSE